MATAEGLSWGYLGYFFGQGWVSWLSALVAGGFVFSIIWLIDASFMTLDTARAFYDKALLGRDEISVARQKLQTGAGILVRAAIILASLVISAPFLAQIIFERDIDAVIARQNGTLIAAKRGELAAEWAEGINKLEDDIDEAERLRVPESAGQGPSGQIGRGPVVRTIESQLEDLRAELAAKRKFLSDSLGSFDSMTNAELARLYGLEFLDGGLQARGRALKQLMDNPSYTSAELAVRAFLAFIFLSLVILKMFSPRSVRIYYNEQLQDFYNQYLTGRFDRWLEDVEKSTSPKAAVWPLQFEDWCVNTYTVIRKEDERKRRMGEIRAQLEAKQDGFKRLISETNAELGPLQERHKRLLGKRLELENRRTEIVPEQAARESELTEARRNLNEMSQQIAQGEVLGKSFSVAVSVKSQLEEKIGQLESVARTALVELETNERSRGILDTEIKQVEELIGTKATLVGEMEEELATARREAGGRYSS